MSMMASNLHHPSVRFTRLSDRFRSLWTFYQFLGGVFKHLDRGPLPFSYDFQSLYRRLQEVAPKVGIEGVTDVQKDLDEIDRELQRIHAELRDIDSQLPPSLLRRFFDRLRQQDEKILFVLAKFYVQSVLSEIAGPEEADVLVEIGHAYETIEDLKNATKFYKKALKLNTEECSAWISLAKVHVTMEKRKEAIRAFGKAVEHCPDNPLPYRFLGYLYKDVNKLKRAKAMFEKYVELAPKADDVDQIKEEIDYLNQDLEE